MVLRNVSLLIALLATAPTALAGTFYCCNDPSGRRVCGDAIPEQCKGRGYKIIDGQGNTVREILPPMTPEQKAQLDAENKKKAEAEAYKREQRRRDAALLETYTSLQDIDRLRVRSEEDMLRSMKLVEERIADAQKRRKKFENEAEFYKNKDLPTDVARGLRDLDSEIRAQKSLLDSKQSDLDATRAKYAEDRRRYLEITTGAGKTFQHPAATTSPTMGGATAAKP